MFDLLAVAFQADITRVVTFMMARDVSQQTYPAASGAGPDHALSHHGNRPGANGEAREGQHVPLQVFAKFLEKLRATPDGDGSLLDHSVICSRQRHEQRNRHSHTPLPLLVARRRQHQGQPSPQHPDGNPSGTCSSASRATFGVETRDRFGRQDGPR